MAVQSVKAWAIGVVLAPLALWSMGAQAAFTCPTSPGASDVVYAISVTSSCLLVGNGNSLNGNGADAVNTLGYVTLFVDTSDASSPADALKATGFGAADGAFTIVAPSGYANFVLGFQDVNSTNKPDYAAFSLTGLNGGSTLSGSWTIRPVTDSSGVLSRVILYGMPVPLPPAAWLLLSGLAGLGVLRRRKTG